jgi:hypothetical protein
MKAYEFFTPATVVAALSLAGTAFSFDRATNMLSLQPDGYHKAALASGGTYNAGSYFSPPKSRVDGLEQLVDASSTIVVASVSDAIPELLDEGRYIRTNYRLQLIKSIKGEMATTDLLEIPGGTYRFSDGSVVNQVEEAWKALQTGKTYILFLTRWPDRPTVLRLTSAAQGIFELDSDGQHLISDTYLQNDSLRDEASLGKAVFLEKVKSMVTATKHSGKACNARICLNRTPALLR